MAKTKARFVLPADIRAKKYNQLSTEIAKAGKRLDSIQKTIASGKTVTFDHVQALNADLTRLLARAGNASWE